MILKKNSIFLSTLKCCSPPLIYNNPNIMTVKPTLMCDLWQLCHPSSWFVPENSWKSKPSSIFFFFFPLMYLYIYISTLTKNLGGQRCLEKLKFWENLTDSCQKKCNMHCAAEFDPFIYLLENKIPPWILAAASVFCSFTHI